MNVTYDEWMTSFHLYGHGSKVKVIQWPILIRLGMDVAYDEWMTSFHL